MCLSTLTDKEKFIEKAEKAKRGYIYCYSFAKKKENGKYYPPFWSKRPYKILSVSTKKRVVQFYSAVKYVPHFHRYIHKSTAKRGARKAQWWRNSEKIVTLKWLVPIRDITAAGMNDGRTIICKSCKLIGEV